ncbi:EscU/YscU/HrcU family type III secretion system export apparatus switch protein [Rhizobacter sp. J219]|jgi:flagellar biosynthetic protein FlhB|uniref:EscU/YscU/HrcU family type III secretion system export apparatus switch protein n=1 Tax=Rhizobacter sp. J219 TaxID=2898430 RepID=UPI002150BC29|nr:EscU/YscU/HrcU family type III secretion system export apparatus switch protein [Rhizobacter sp. J219]MCR5883309.1 EscU/YscU/HrcU family type III secretion system export apparatus switch protein [Rhizobacter sp. J219]
MADSDQDRNLPASQRKLDKARREGQVVRSRDLGHFAAIAVGGAAVVAAAPLITHWSGKLLVNGLRFNAASVQSPAFMTERLAELALQMLLIVLPLGVLMMVVALAASLFAGGWVWTFKPLMPNFGKLNPITGIPRIFSKQQLIDALKASLLALILGAIGALYLRANIDTFGGVLSMALPAALSHAGTAIVGGMLLLLLALALFATVDVPLQKFLHAQRLKMSHQEMKQEQKETEGNVEVKAKARARMREMANKRMLAAIPNADLVVMNPTHYAVALKYDDAKMGAPKVVAKGADLMAFKIRDTAKESQVPVLQAPVLARALYAHAEVDREIPAALFSAVAQVLAYVYQLRAAIAGRVQMPGALPELHVPPELDPHNKPGYVPDEVLE